MKQRGHVTQQITAPQPHTTPDRKRVIQKIHMRQLDEDVIPNEYAEEYATVSATVPRLPLEDRWYRCRVMFSVLHKSSKSEAVPCKLKIGYIVVIQRAVLQVGGRVCRFGAVLSVCHLGKINGARYPA